MNGGTAPLALVQEARVELMLALCAVVRRTGQYVRSLPPGEIHDTVSVDRHQFSTVDTGAAIMMRKVAQEVLRSFRGTILEESEISRATLDPQRIDYPVCLFDAVEGSTNTKRGLAARIRRPILGGTSALVLEGPTLQTIAASAFYDFASRQVFSAVRTEPGTFLSFVNRKVIPRRSVIETKGDSRVYVVVPGYSHSNIDDRAAVERALIEEGFCTTGGSRSSALDLLDLVGNQADAYVDLRTLFSRSTGSRDEVLHSWDVGGLLPVLDGLGFMITDARKQGWQTYSFAEHLPLVVARPKLGQRILDIIRSLPFVAPQDDEQMRPTVPLPSSRLGP